MTRRAHTIPALQRRVASWRVSPAFALPIVLMLALVVALGVVILLERHGVTQLATARQIRGYSAYHQSAGLREVFNRWMPTVRGRVLESLEEDGRAFRLNMPKSGYIDVYMADGQGTVLSDTETLSGRQREILEDWIAILKSPPGELAQRLPPETTRLFRAVGPPQISVKSADPAVIEALCMAVLADPSSARQAANAIVNRVGPDTFGSKNPSRRDRDAAASAVASALGKTPGQKGKDESAASAGIPAGGGNQVGRALMELNLDPQDIREIESFLTERNTLWMVVAEMKDDSGRVYDRSGGLYESSENRTESFNQNAGFLTWELLPLE